jgi:hypothetical protein
MDYSKELESAKQRVLQDAYKRGILLDAERQANTLIEHMLFAAGVEEVEWGRL